MGSHFKPRHEFGVHVHDCIEAGKGNVGGVREEWVLKVQCITLKFMKTVWQIDNKHLIFWLHHPQDSLMTCRFWCMQLQLILLCFFLQYVEKLEKIIRFIIKEKALSLNDLDSIWAAQVGVLEIFTIFLLFYVFNVLLRSLFWGLWPSNTFIIY